MEEAENITNVNGAITLEFIKLYLRVDTDAEDELIKLLIDVAREFVIDSVGVCDESKAEVRILMLSIISTLYEKRCFTVEKSDEVQYTFNQIIMQLQKNSGDSNA
ncbi:hypothetical protein lbkm_3830 [Lachnospiraceae bacterium KM106-2]|nr:hypothetical protein lbkm_3830 [Lachnospiraceae bacterium KM106-2]